MNTHHIYPSVPLYEVIDRILDKGIVIDTYMNISLLGLHLLSLEARIVTASVDTWLKYATAINRIEKENDSKPLVCIATISFPSPIEIRCNGMNIVLGRMYHLCRIKG